MLDYSSSEVMSRKEYLNKKKRNSSKVWFLKYILLALVIIGLVVYVIYQLNVYKTVTEAAHSMMEEAKLLKTYKMVFMGKSYVKGGNNIMYLYLGQDESRQKIDVGSGMQFVSVEGRYIYGLKDRDLYKIDLLDKTSELILEKEAHAYYIYKGEVYIYEYRNGQSGLYKKINGDFQEIIHAKIFQTQMTDEYVFTVENSKEGKSIIKRDNTYGEGVKISGKDSVINIRLVGDRIYYTNATDGNKIYSINLSGEDRKCETSNGAIGTFAELYFQQYIDVYNGSVVYVSKDNKVYMSSPTLEQDELLLDEKAVKIQLLENMLYIKLQDNLDVIRINLDTKEKEKITSVRSTDVYMFK